MNRLIERLTFIPQIRELLRLRAQVKEVADAWRGFKVAYSTVQEAGVPQNDIERENLRRFEDFLNQEAKRIDRALKGGGPNE